MGEPTTLSTFLGRTPTPRIKIDYGIVRKFAREKVSFFLKLMRSGTPAFRTGKSGRKREGPLPLA